MDKKPTTVLGWRQQFIERANILHENKFDYSQFEYVKAKTASTIICSLHGDFQQSSMDHLRSKYGCPACSLVKRGDSRRGVKTEWESRKLSVEDYLERLNLPKHFSLDTTNYIGITKGTVTLFCPSHGEQIFNPKVLLINKYKCTKCSAVHFVTSKTESFEQFLEKAEKIHGNKFTYLTPEKYVNRKSILEMNCKLHGNFKKVAQKVLSGQACFKCRIDDLVSSGVLTGGYNEALFKSDREIALAPAFVYYIKVGHLYKIGITKDKVKNRLRSIKSDSKADVEIIETFECNLENAYRIEQYILNTFADFRVYRQWSTELFSKNVLKGSSLKDFS